MTVTLTHLPMKRIYTYGGRSAVRNLTVGNLEWRAASLEGTCLGRAETTYMPKAEYEKLMDALDKM